MLANIYEEFDSDEIDFELFCRLVAIYVEVANSPEIQPQEQIVEESQQNLDSRDFDDSESYT